MPRWKCRKKKRYDPQSINTNATFTCVIKGIPVNTHLKNKIAIRNLMKIRGDREAFPRKVN